MKRIMLFTVISIAAAFVLPTLLLLIFPQKMPEAGISSTPTPIVTPEVEPTPLPEPKTITDADMPLKVLTPEGTAEMTMEEFLPLSLAAEMPASFESEALKAQAVALRSYIMYCSEHKKSAHPEADICCDHNCCVACADTDALGEKWGADFETFYEKIRSAVTATDGQHLAWEGETISAVFHSSSGGITESSENLWQSSVPYLVSVESPETEEDVPNLLSVVEVSTQDFAKTISSAFPKADFSAGAESWLGATVENSSGRIGSLTVGGVSISGAQMRSLFSLRSTDFTLSYNGEHFVFSVMGYGHGVGMSQYGANVMARRGKMYGEILTHYYPGTQLVIAARYHAQSALPASGSLSAFSLDLFTSA